MDTLTATRSSESLYDRDYFAWSKQQAAALRARASSANMLDYDNLAEEVEDLGRSMLRACRSQLLNVLTHLLKLRYIASPETFPHWRGELLNFRGDLHQDLTKTLENVLRPELGRLYGRAVKSLRISGQLTEAQAEQAASEGPPTWSQVLDEDWWPVAASADDQSTTR